MSVGKAIIHRPIASHSAAIPRSYLEYCTAISKSEQSALGTFEAQQRSGYAKQNEAILKDASHSRHFLGPNPRAMRYYHKSHQK